MDWLGRGEGSSRFPAEIFDRAQCGACRPADVVHPRFQTIEFLDHGEWNDDVTSGEAVETARVGDQH
jgi:hypothetical protein